MIPAWLADHLENTGRRGRDGIGRRAYPHHCRACGQLVLTGLDNDLCAGVAHADPTPLAPLGEALALIDGRTTYALTRGPGRIELTLRDPWQITGTPAGTAGFDVVAAHTCTAVDLPGLPSAYRPTAVALSEPPY